MRPILFHFLGFPVPSYSAFMVLGYIAALFTLLWMTRRVGEPAPPPGGLTRAQVWDLFIVMVLSSVIGSKIGHVLFEASGHVDEQGRAIDGVWALLKSDPWHWARLGESGYVWYGGLLFALLFAINYFRVRPHLRGWLYADAFAPAIMLGAAVGRTGCFLAGCCFGQVSDVPWAVVLPGKSVAVHPTQLYDAMVAAVLGCGLLWRYPRRRFDGEIIALLLLFYPALRGFTEIFRGDLDRGMIGPLSTSQFISIPLFAIAGVLYLRLLSKSRAHYNPRGDGS